MKRYTYENPTDFDLIDVLYESGAISRYWFKYKGDKEVFKVITSRRLRTVEERLAALLDYLKLEIVDVPEHIKVRKIK